MNIRKVIKKRIRHEGGGANVVGDITGAIAANVGKDGGGGSTHVSSRQTIVQRDGATEVRSATAKEES